MARATDFGIQSFCFRNFKDNAEVAQKVRELDLNKIEVCAVHADFNDVAKWKDTVQIYRDHGVEIVSIGVQNFVGDDQERNWFECAAEAGTKHISAHFRIDTFTTAIPKTAALAEEFNINLGIHCHGGYQFAGSPVVLKHLIELGGPRFGLTLDTAWCMQIGPKLGNPIAWVKDFGAKVYGVHFKDFVFNKDGSWQDVVVGNGNLDLPGFIDALDEQNFDGMAVIEYEADPENPMPALKECVQEMRAALGQPASA